MLDFKKKLEDMQKSREGYRERLANAETAVKALKEEILRHDGAIWQLERLLADCEEVKTEDTAA